ncbi:10084_t:CDS:2 [Entrophospora sp. SA101]|nr:10084_t:CDS:2 [Entrophospora sp. SA101]
MIKPDNKTNEFDSSMLTIFNMFTDDPYLVILYAGFTLIVTANTIEKVDRNELEKQGLYS